MHSICYIDTDNISHRRVSAVLDYLTEDANLNILSRKAFGDFWKVESNWKDVCIENNIIPKFSQFINGRKNSTDMTLMLDAHTDLLKNQCIDVFVIFSNDADFVPITMEIQYYGKQVWVVGHRNRISDSLLKICNKFIDININNDNVQINEKSNIIPNNVNATTHSNLNENIDETNKKTIKNLNEFLDDLFKKNKVNSMRLSIVRMLPIFRIGNLNPKLYGDIRFISFIKRYIRKPYYIQYKSCGSDAWIIKE